MEKAVRKIQLKDKHNYDLKYRLSKTPEERITAVEFLRKQFYESKDGAASILL
ncbi:MAG: hypothetical protein AB1394_12700 [Bacteroidota bacterium]